MERVYQAGYSLYLPKGVLSLQLSLFPSHASVPRFNICPDGADYATPGALALLAKVMDESAEQLRDVLERRDKDRRFIDVWTRAAVEINSAKKTHYTDPEYVTVLGARDGEGRVVVGPQSAHWREAQPSRPVAPIPRHLQGPHVTLFGPPDSARMAINAMNAVHRKLPDEPSLIAELVHRAPFVPKWGADDEDSKTPLHSAFLAAGVHLKECFDGSIHLEGYKLEKEKLSQPIKRFPGLAIPSTSVFLDGFPVPLHTFDFVLHMFHNWERPEALTFYVPKLESEHEAAYLAHMIRVTEAHLVQMHPGKYHAGTVRIFVVLENPRAVFRVNEIMDALHPYFVGASLGWHDYLASAARLFKEDPHYRIPVKADPDIVIKHIKESHVLLSDIVGPRQGIKIGGMYGILPFSREIKEPSMQATLYGYIRDVFTQLKRGLDGFWVAHPDFVRIGIALVQAYKEGEATTRAVIASLITEPRDVATLVEFVFGPDVPGLDTSHPLYMRALLAAERPESDVIKNNDPEEIRYNVFQAIQYVADWLSGNGCVALPAFVRGQIVRVMDDLATTERSRWEIWAEIHHGRFSIERFLEILCEEMDFIKNDRKTDKKMVQVKYNEQSAKWYPIAFKLLLRLATDANPVEFATEIMLPFAVEEIRNAADPWALAEELCPGKYTIDPYILRWLALYQISNNNATFATQLAGSVALDTAILDLDSVKHGGSTFIDRKALEASPRLSLFSASERNVHVALVDHSPVSPGSYSAADTLREIAVSTNHGLDCWSLAASSATAQIAARSAHQPLPAPAFISVLLASLSIEYFSERSIGRARDIVPYGTSLDSSVASLVALANLPAVPAFITAPGTAPATLRHLLNWTMLRKAGPDQEPGSAWNVAPKPGAEFNYAFREVDILLRRIIEALEGQTMQEIAEPWLAALGIPRGEVDFRTNTVSAFAMTQFLAVLSRAFGKPETAAPIHHATAMAMTYGYPDTGSAAFNGGMAGLGLFVADCAQNRVVFRHDPSGAVLFHAINGPDAGRGFVVQPIKPGDFDSVIRAVLYVLHRFSWLGFIHGSEIPTTGPNTTVTCAGSLSRYITRQRFEPDLPETTRATHPHLTLVNDPLSPHNRAIGSSVVTVTSQRFARCENLVSPFVPVFDPRIFGRMGKIMDSWETGRHNMRSDGRKYDVAVFKLAQPSFVDAVLVSTMWHSGNQAEFTRVDLFNADTNAWETAVPRVMLAGHSIHRFALRSPVAKATGFRILNFPDGGISRIGLFALRDLPSDVASKFASAQHFGEPEKYTEACPEPIPHAARGALESGAASPLIRLPLKPAEVRENWAVIATRGVSRVDVASALFGGETIFASNQRYGPASAVIAPWSARGMFDGFESARSRMDGHVDYVVIRLAKPTSLIALDVDQKFFVNNSPFRLTVLGFDARTLKWVPLVNQIHAKIYAGSRGHYLIPGPHRARSFSKLTVISEPDGGINRVRAWAAATPELLSTHSTLAVAAADAELESCDAELERLFSKL